MTFVSLVSPRLSCNTRKLRHKSTRFRSRSWCFTWNNYTEENLSQLSQPEFFKTKIIKLIFQEEIGKENTKHLQGFVQFKNQIDFSKLKEYLPKCHLEKCKSVAASIKYCSKEDTRSGTRYTYGISPAELTHEKKPPLSEEEIMANLKADAHKDIDAAYDAGLCWICDRKIEICKCMDL